MCMHACVCACVRACVRAFVRACVCVPHLKAWSAGYVFKQRMTGVQHITATARPQEMKQTRYGKDGKQQ